jgi:hypothetical protein
MVGVVLLCDPFFLSLLGVFTAFKGFFFFNWSLIITHYSNRHISSSWLATIVKVIIVETDSNLPSSIPQFCKLNEDHKLNNLSEQSFSGATENNNNLEQPSET